jgi:hypothetical protein
MARRPAAGRPFRPFAGQPLEGQTPAPEREIAPPAVIVAAATEAPATPELSPEALACEAPPSYEEPAIAAYEPPTPADEAPAAEPVSMAPAYEAWETFLDATPAVPDSVAEPIVEKAPEEMRVSSVTEEVAEIIAATPTEPAQVSGLTSVFEWSGPEPTIKVASEQAMITPDADVTAEVPAFQDAPDEEPSAVDEIVALQNVASVAPRKAFETPIYVTPANQASVDTLIDEVDAAFITAGLPTNDHDASEQTLYAATLLESIARRLRTGELRLGAGSKVSSEESALATVLASLLASR